MTIPITRQQPLLKDVTLGPRKAITLDETRKRRRVVDEDLKFRITTQVVEEGRSQTVYK